jgi:hypothetical protein
MKVDNKRLAVKWVRDGIKRKYKKAEECALCGTKDELQFHHFYSVTLLFEKWLRENNLKVETDDDVLAVRERFSLEHKIELFDETVTLCKYCHNSRLHKVYGITPPLSTADKQKRWIALQAEKVGRKYEFKRLVDRET